ncbi:hypothetical protein ElyMa_006727700 [Elysia marginata]|uniref:Uncharacterized protein n=1 Tax=Elysia marginata TaxID=1093978 RepID=A0AAV4IVC7_9GAST|nr:hypothetical protein ElyMa_006727700 [Elysia marginata]
MQATEKTGNWKGAVVAHVIRRRNRSHTVMITVPGDQLRLALIAVGWLRQLGWLAWITIGPPASFITLLQHEQENSGYMK